MDERIESIYWETVFMETKVAEFDHLLSVLFVEDENFWSGLSDEGKNNAMLIHGAKDVFFEEGLFPSEELDSELLNISDINYNFDVIMSQYELMPPQKKVAILDALKMENHSKEYYLQLTHKKSEKNPAIELLRNITGAKINHVQRIAEKLERSVQPVV